MNEFIRGVNDVRLFYEQHVPSSPIEWILIVHGWGEHCGAEEEEKKSKCRM